MEGATNLFVPQMPTIPGLAQAKETNLMLYTRWETTSQMTISNIQMNQINFFSS